MLYPLFDKDCNLVAWVEPEKHIFDTKMKWIAYISSDHVWSSESGNWLGPIKGLTCLDTDGKVFAWSPSCKIEGSPRNFRPARAFKPARPFSPARPFAPPRPFKPPTPSFGWSRLTLSEWLSQ